jgi:hypothetical protein
MITPVSSSLLRLGELLGEKAMPDVWLDDEVAEDFSDEFC